MSEAPKRYVELKFTIGADSYKELLRGIENFVTFMYIEHPDLDHNHNGVTGGPDYGYDYDFTFNPGMTHERYIEEVNAYLEADRAAKKTATE